MITSNPNILGPNRHAANTEAGGTNEAENAAENGAETDEIQMEDFM